MIFASDLDRTLIYSKRFIDQYNSGDAEPVTVEYKDGSPLSFMTGKSADLIRLINDALSFIPVTTRTVEQFQRIDLGIATPYAIVNNGGTILVDGEEDIEWQSLLQARLKADSMHLNSVLNTFIEHYKGDWVKSVRCADNLFLYCIVDQARIPDNFISEFGARLKECNWQISHQGRKIYFIPEPVQKGYALSYLAAKLKKKVIVSAGDSFLDLSFMAVSQKAWAPPHGELFSCYRENAVTKGVYFTSAYGAAASDEILTNALKECEVARQQSTR